MSMRRFSLTIICVLIFVTLIPHVQGQEPPLYLFTEQGQVKSSVELETLWFLDDAQAVRRFAPIEVNPALRGSDALKTNQSLIIELFDLPPMDGIIARTLEQVNGAFTIRGVIADPGDGYFLVSTYAGRSLATIIIFGEESIYRISSDPLSGQHYLMELNRNELQELHGPTEIPPPPTPREKQEQQQRQRALNQKSLGPDDHATMDVMVLYTPAARDWAQNNESGIENTIAIAMEYAQLVSDRSELGITYRMVHSRLVDYVESSSAGVDLRRLTARTDFNPWGQMHDGEIIPGYLYEAHTLRNQYGADLVAMFPVLTGTGGVGWQLMDPGGRPDYGFSLTRVQQASWTYTHIHEMGHNMGAHHHKEQNVQPGPGVFSYAAGWRWTGSDGGRYASVMTYASGQYFDDNITHNRAPYFSNPEVSFRDVPTGHPEHGDNASAIRQTKHVVSAYRSVETLMVEGYVYDEHDLPMSRARVEIMSQGAQMLTEDDGYFSFGYLPPGDHVIRVSREGYYPQQHAITASHDQTVFREFHMELLVDAAVSGYVASADDPGQGLDGAVVHFSRDNEVYVTFTDNGFFMITDIPGGFTYDLMVAYPGFWFVQDELALGTSPEAFENIYLEKAFLPVEEIHSVETDDFIDVSWDTPGFVGDYRHDGGDDTGGLGFATGENSVMGGAYRRHAWINQVSWLPSVSSVEKANVRILALNSEGIPDRNQVLYSAYNIGQTPGQWNHHILDEPFYAPFGFFVGVGGEGSFYLRTDEHNFSPGTNFRSSDIGRFDLRDMAEGDFQRNYYIRAFGYDFGPWLMQEPKGQKQLHFAGDGGAAEEACLAVANPLDVASNEKMDLPEPIGFNVYLDDFNNPHVEMIAGNTYRFTGLPHGRYYVGVQVVYPGGESEIVQKRVFSGAPRYILSLEVHPDNQGVVTREGLYTENSGVTVDAIPMAGHIFSHWENEYGTEISRRPTYEFLMPAWDLKLTAVFVQDPEGLTELKVFPNPSHGRLNIVSSKTISEIRLVNMMGKVVYHLEGYQQTYHQVRVEGATEGIYILQVKTDDGWFSERVQILQPF